MIRELVLCFALMFASVQALAQRMELGAVRPLIEGEMIEMNDQLELGGDPARARQRVSGQDNSFAIRIRLRAEAQTSTNFRVIVTDLNGVRVAAYSAKDLTLGKDIWTVQVPGVAAIVEIQKHNAGGDDERAVIAISGVISLRKPDNPMLSIIGAYDLETMSSLRDEKYLHDLGRAVAKLSFVRGNRSLVCSGFMISDSHMLTNEHCVNSQDVCDTTMVLFGFEMPTPTAEQIASQSVRCARLVVADELLDVALLELQDKPGIKWGKLILSETVTAIDELLLIIQHPNGEEKHVSRKDCFVSRYPAKGRGNSTDFGHLCDTMGGSSGSPVISRRTLEVVGLHHYGVDPDDKEWEEQNRAVRIELIRSRLGL